MSTGLVVEAISGGRLTWRSGSLQRSRSLLLLHWLQTTSFSTKDMQGSCSTRVVSLSCLAALKSGCTADKPLCTLFWMQKHVHSPSNLVMHQSH